MNTERSSSDGLLLIGSYGRGNIGDDAFLLAAMKLFQGYTLYINSADDSLLPKEVKGKVNTIATAGFGDLGQKIRTFMRIKHIVYCGGDLWVELYGDRFPRKSLYKMVIVNMLARLFGKKVHYVGCGIGKLSGYSLFLARLSARLAQSIVVREARSAEVLNLSKIQILPDLVTNLDIEATNRSEPQHTPVIGISLLYHLPDPETSFPKLIGTLRDVLESSHFKQCRIILFPMLSSPHDSHDDIWASEQLKAALPHSDVSISQARDVKTYVQELRSVDILVGARLHANILALLAGIPAIGIAYRPKVTSFFTMNNLQDYCLELESLTAAQLHERLQTMLASYHMTSRRFTKARAQTLMEGAGYQDFVADQF